MAFTWSIPISQPRNTSHQLVFTRSTMDNSQVPVAWFSGENLKRLRWNGEELALPANPHPHLLQTRGDDHVNLGKAPNKLSGQFPAPKARGPGSLVIQIGDEITEYGGPLSSQGVDRIWWSVGLENQVPSIKLEYKEGSQTYRIIFYGHEKQGKVTFHDPDTLKSGIDGLKIPEKHASAAKEGRLLGISLHFQAFDINRLLNSIVVQHDEAGDRWSSDVEMLNTLTNPDLSGFDEQVRRMLCQGDLTLSFFRESVSEEKDNLWWCVGAYNYWHFLMQLFASNGQWWWYKMHKKARSPPVPFWLVTKFRAHVEKNQLVRLEPLEWSSIVQRPTDLKENPTILTPEMASYLRKLGLLRVSEWQNRGLHQKPRATDPNSANEVGPSMLQLFAGADWMVLATMGHTSSRDATATQPPSAAETSTQESLVKSDSAGTPSGQPLAPVCVWCYMPDHATFACTAQITALEHDHRKAEYYRQHPESFTCSDCYERGHIRQDCAATFGPMERYRRWVLWACGAPGFDS